MYQLYSLLLTLGFILLLPRFIFDAFQHGKYVAGFRERLGFLSHPTTTKPVIWIHCVSVGETQAARPLVDLLLQKYPQFDLVVSTITLTGQNLARQVFQDKANKVFYFPFDWRWTVRRALQTIKPSAVLLMETELWPNFLHEGLSKNVPLALVNGRISKTSERRYRLVKGFLIRVVNNLNLAIMQTPTDGERLRKLGFDPTKMFVSGSLKFDAGRMLSPSPLTDQFRERFGLNAGDVLILGASTHSPEERILLESFQAIRGKHPLQTRLMIVPRHPERFNEVASLIQSSGLRWTRRSNAQSEADRNTDVILLDSIGELPAAYPLAQIVFVGGSIARFGGHNILEPAAVGGCIVTGAHTHNFQAIVSEFHEAGAIVQLPSLQQNEMAGELAGVLDSLLADPAKCETLRSHAARLVQQNQGATERTLTFLEPILNAALRQATTEGRAV